MELASPESIRALMRAQGNPAPVRRRHGAQKAVQPANRGRKVRCRCGQCPQCLDNARWDRIYAEKFADPDYYARRVTWVASPLTSL
jgi:hypothetical protein